MTADMQRREFIGLLGGAAVSLAAIAATNHCHLLADCDTNGRVPGGRSTARDRRCRAA